MDKGQRCEAERSERRDEIVNEDMLRDKGASRLRGKEKILSRRDFARSELGELLLLYFDKYRRAKYWKAIARADFAVKPPLTACAISWIQFLHV